MEQQPVIHLKALNWFKHFKMEGLHLLQDLLQQGAMHAHRGQLQAMAPLLSVILAVQVLGTDGELEISTQLIEFQQNDHNSATREDQKGAAGSNETYENSNNVSKGPCSIQRDSN